MAAGVSPLLPGKNISTSARLGTDAAVAAASDVALQASRCADHAAFWHVELQ